MKIQLFNTLSRSIEDFTPLSGNSVRVYTCGPTPYNYAHLGNLRAFLFPDFLCRVLRTVGKYDVRWVMNITDIDDKTIKSVLPESNEWRVEMGERSDDIKTNLRTFTTFYADALFDDLKKVGIERDDLFATPRATEFIPQMLDLITNIAKNGYAYERDGSIYFNVAKWRSADTYGKLLNIDFDNFREGVRIDAQEYDREQVSDFVLWKGKKEGEPFWDFDFDGKNIPGRPGWHIECSAMEFELLGLPFDIHTGGVDLKFPHHEDEIAQSKAGYGIEPTTFWCHNEFLDVEGEKMSKSLGNFFTLQDLLAKNYHPVDIRYLILSAHYRTRLNFTFTGLEASKKARLRIQEYLYQVWERAGGEELPTESDALALALKNEVFADLADDLNVPKALGEIFTFINNHSSQEISPETAKALLTCFRALNAIFGFWEISKKPIETVEIPAEILALAEARWAAKKARDFAQSDILRKQIAEAGFVVKDTKDGYEIAKA